MNISEIRRWLVLDNEEFNETIRYMIDFEILNFFNNMGLHEREVVFKKADIKNSAKTLCFLSNEIAIDIILYCIHPKKVLEISRILPGWRKRALIGSAKEEDKKKLCMLLYGLRIHQFNENEEF